MTQLRAGINLFILLSLSGTTSGFSSLKLSQNSHFARMKPQCFAKRRSGGKKQGFDASGGKGFQNSQSKTYVRSPIRDMIDVEGAMGEFFSSNAEWSPLFNAIAKNANVPAMSFLEPTETEFSLDTDSSLWKRLDAKPTAEEDLAHLSIFLDAMQQALVDIPVNELTKNDDNDLDFLEEGRRMLCVSRFHVLRDVKGGSVENFDTLFSTCWSEVAELHTANQADTGSLILLPDYDLADLRRFTDMNLQRPLDWLGLSSTFEIASMQREVPAIRLLHKLSDMPTEPWNDGKPDE